MDLYTNEDSRELMLSLDKALSYIEYALKNGKLAFVLSSKSAVELYKNIGIIGYSLLFNYRVKCYSVNRILGKFWKIGSVQLIILKIIPFSL